MGDDQGGQAATSCLSFETCDLLDLGLLPGYLLWWVETVCGLDRLSLCTASNSLHSPSTNHGWQERNPRVRLHNRTSHMVMEFIQVHRESPAPQTPDNFLNVCPYPRPWTLNTFDNLFSPKLLKDRSPKSPM